jgi:hypothetical protein
MPEVSPSLGPSPTFVPVPVSTTQSNNPPYAPSYAGTLSLLLALTTAVGLAACQGNTLPGGGGADQGVGGSGDRGLGGATGTSGLGGATGLGGAGGRAGASGTDAGGRGAGGRTGTGGQGGGVVVVPPSCGATTPNLNPFGCNLAWGMNNPGGNGALSSYSYLQFMSFWIGSEARADGTLGSCSACRWLTNQVAPSNLIPVFYAYIIGFYGHVNGLPDGNVNPNGPNLTTGGANLIRNNRAKIVSMYGSYAQQAHTAWPTKPLVWLLEGDFVQYTGTTQANPLSYTELAQLAEDITCAIKANMPNAVVAINHSTWNANNVTNAYWAAMATVNYDMAWTSGSGNANGFYGTGTTATSYNGTTATYAYLHRITGRTILVDTSFGLSATGDSWSNIGAANVNARIADGVVAVNVTNSEDGYAGNITGLGTLSTTCH